jgi:hypothetical protein
MAAQVVRESDKHESNLRGYTGERCERLKENRMPVGRIRLTDATADEIAFPDSEAGSKPPSLLGIDAPE